MRTQIDDDLDSREFSRTRQPDPKSLEPTNRYRDVYAQKEILEMMARKEKGGNNSALVPQFGGGRQALSEEKRVPVLSGIKGTSNAKVNIRITRQVPQSEFSREESSMRDDSPEPVLTKPKSKLAQITKNGIGFDDNEVNQEPASPARKVVIKKVVRPKKPLVEPTDS